MEKKKMQDVCIVNPHLDAKLSGDMKVSFLPMTAVSTDGRTDLTKTLESEKIKNYSVFQNGDVLFAKITPCMENGKGAIADNLLNGYGAGSTEFIVLRPKTDIISSKWLFLYLSQQSFRQECKQHMTGSAGQKRVQPKYLASCTVPVLPLDEQKRIVARIEELFSELDKAVETLNTTKQQLAVYRQAVLKAAFNSLTCKKTIREMSTIVTSGSRGWAKFYSDNGARFIRITDLTRDGINLKNANVQCVLLPSSVEGKRSRLNTNDVLVSITADLGSIAVVPQSIGEAYINQHIAMIRFKNHVQGEFMAWYLKSDIGQKDLLRNKRGGGKLGLGLDDIRDTPVPVVSNAESEKILSQINARMSVCDSIEKTVETALFQTEALRQSILKQAFEGRLI